MPTSTWLDSILRMPNIESFPDTELLDMMHFFAHGEHRIRQISNFPSDEARSRWFEDIAVSEQKLLLYKRVLRATCYHINIQLTHCNASMRIVAQGTWMNSLFLLDQIVNAVFSVAVCAELTKWSAVRDAIEEQLETLPALNRLALRVCPRTNDHDDAWACEEMARFLLFAVADTAKEKGLKIEAHCRTGPAPAPERWCG